MQLLLPTLYIIACVALGLAGRNRKFGGWGYFFAALALTPVFGVLLLLASDPKSDPDD